MKKQFVFVICLILLMTLAGCGTSDSSHGRPGITTADDAKIVLRSGTYLFTVTDENGFQPYIEINMEDNTFFAGRSLLMSHAEKGTLEIKDGQLIAVTTNINVRYVFEIKNEVTLVATEHGLFGAPAGSEFVRTLTEP